MAHLLAPKPANIHLPVFFNVDGVVGAPPATNNREDVLLVQFAFKVVADSPIQETSPEVLAASRAVTVDGICGPLTINAIRVLQKHYTRSGNKPGKVVDGRVSPSRGNYYYSGGGGLWTIIRLNDALQHRNINIWPRLDNIAGCPAELKAMVKRQVVGI